MEPLDGCFVIDERYDAITGLRSRLLPDQEQVTVMDASPIHGIALGAEKEVAVRRTRQTRGNRDQRLDVLFSQERSPARHIANQRHFNCAGMPGCPRQVPEELKSPVRATPDKAVLRQPQEDLGGGAGRLVPEENLESAN
jgi:hypothetical protein